MLAAACDWKARDTHLLIATLSSCLSVRERLPANSVFASAPLMTCMFARPVALLVQACPIHRLVLCRVCHGMGVCLALLPAWPRGAIGAMGCIAGGRWVPSLAPTLVSSKRVGGG